jgi:hypothetical protein
LQLSQNFSAAKQSQYSFKHLEFLQLHFLFTGVEGGDVITSFAGDFAGEDA